MHILRTITFIISLLYIVAPNSVKSEEISSDKCTIKVGVVPQFEQRRLLATWQPILDKLQEKTGCDFHLSGNKHISEFEENFKAGLYDMAYMNPYHAVMANKEQEYIPIIRSGAKKLLGILVVQKDSPIQHVSELNGQEIAFPSPNALGASLLMRAELAKKHGLDITPRYVKTHSSVYLHVLKGLTKAGGGVGRTLKEQDSRIKDKLRILYKTQQVYAHPLVIHPRIEATIRKKIQATFITIGKNNPELVAKIPMKQPVATNMQDYDNLKKMGLDDFEG